MEVGKTYTVECPFIRDAFTEYDEDGQHTTLSWRPGIVWEQSGPEDACARAHGMGSVHYTVISIHELPAPYPKRVFFTRRWVNPDGREFGRRNLHIMTASQFARRLRGYAPAGVDRWTEFRVEDMSADEREKALRS